MRMKLPVVLAKAKGRKLTSVEGVRGSGEVSESTSVLNSRSVDFSLLTSKSRSRSGRYTSQVTVLRTATRETILAVDIGATTIKFGVVDADGDLVEEVIRMATPYPCSPGRLVDFITEQI